MLTPEIRSCYINFVDSLSTSRRVHISMYPPYVYLCTLLDKGRRALQNIPIIENRRVSKTDTQILLLFLWAGGKENFLQQTSAVPLASQGKRCRFKLHPRKAFRGCCIPWILEDVPESGPRGGSFLFLPLKWPADFSRILSYLMFNHSHFLLS